MTSRWMTWLVACCMLLVLAACSGDSATTTTSTTSTTTTTTSPTTTSAAPTTTTTSPPTTTSVEAGDDIPYPDNRSNDWLLVMRELNDFIVWLNENPDPDLVAVAFAPETPIYERAFERLEDWVDRGIRQAAGLVSETVSAHELLHNEITGTVILDVADRSSESTRIDTDGSIVEVRPELPLAVSRVTLYWDDGHGWRIAEWNVLEEIEQ